MKTVIEMAREAGWDDHHAEFDTRLKRFAELVRADEREKCEVVAAQAAREAIVFAMDAEREACAKVCEEMHPGLSSKRVAEAIRARGNT